MSASLLIKKTGKPSTVLFSFLLEFFAMLMSTSTESQKVIKQGKKRELQRRNKRID